MTTSTSTSSSSSGPQTSQILLIVELLERIGSHLNPPDLLSCVQVSKHWNDVLIPHLWHTIDDRAYSWACILNVYLSPTAPRLLRIVKAEQDASSNIKESNNAIEEANVLKHIALDVWPSRRTETALWLYRIFQKYGRHIRTLRVAWPIVIRVAGMAGHCTQLRVLTVHHVAMRDGSARNKEGGAIRRQQQSEDLSWAESYTGPTADWQGFWRNIGDEEEEARLCPTIEHLCLGRGLKTLTPCVTPAFVYYALATLPRLKTLNNRFMELDLQRVLEHTSAIHSGGNRNVFYHMDSGCGSNLQLDKDFAHLTTLAIKRSVESFHVLVFLKRLINLDQLFLGQIKWSDRAQPPFADMDDSYGERSRSFTLTGLHLTQFGGLTPEYRQIQEAMAIYLIPRLPSLTELSIDVLIPEVARALASHCKQFRVFRQGGDDESLNEYCTVKTDLNVVSVLLESCPNLRILDAIQHRIDATYLAGHPWACEATLETFRCQIVGLERMPCEEYKAMSTLSEQDSIKLMNQDIAQEKYKRSQEQHYRVYERLSRLARLQILDLGGDIKGVVHYIFGDSGVEPTKEVHGRIYLIDSSPIMDCLDLSLGSGLDQLASLVNLRVFGFEGLDHRIETAELRWFATHWPRLIIMRGLHIDESETLNKRDTKTTRQRQEMQALRPLVHHESATPTSVLETSLHQRTIN
ncbi:hypothetical protein BGZ97_000840 [Linnemannia gamsii]|uniref:F-box domain-containing protein n=1 Tax=Linnemannia gamsii TaxID=64522 RepID=A0A9P6R1N6_9FUNG|nr:hypothetical protein BGZ97_000840 [Linnemannia gamsii]